MQYFPYLTVRENSVHIFALSVALVPSCVIVVLLCRQFLCAVKCVFYNNSMQVAILHTSLDIFGISSI